MIILIDMIVYACPRWAGVTIMIFDSLKEARKRFFFARMDKILAVSLVNIPE